MIRDTSLVLILLIQALFFPGLAQSFSFQQIKLAEQLQFLAERAPPEIAYIQISKDIYETGEDLWFKVYMLDAQNLTPSGLSKTLYLQLLNETTLQAFWHEKYEIQNGFADGRIYLENALPEGDYFIAAFTPNSFFNDTSEFKAVRRIKIIANITSVKPVAAITEKLTSNLPGIAKSKKIQFNTFPEGGGLVSGIQTKLAFKAITSSGEPVDINGTLFEDETPLLDFKSTHSGMGCFNFIPFTGKKYFIRLNNPALDTSFFLPEISQSGMTMKLTARDKESLIFIVTQSTGLKQEVIYLRVQIRGIVYALTMVKLDKEIRIKVPLLGLPQGIAEITLFNGNLIPVAERLVYINPDRKLNIAAELSKEIYSTRGKATLKISVKDEYGRPATANLGVSVFDKIYQNPQDSNNILSHCYLSTELKGRIYNPSFYFNSSNKNRDEALDLLVLTQGWRKYVWNEMNLKRYTEALPHVILDGLEGEIYYPNRKRRRPKEQTFVMTFSPNRDSLNVLIPTDSAGKFIIPADLLKRWENDFIYLKPFGPYTYQLPFKINDLLPPPEFSLQIKLSDPFETINRLTKVKEISYSLPGSIKEKRNLSDLYSVESGIIKIKEVTIKGQRQKVIRGKYLGILDSLAKSAIPDDYVCRMGVLNCPRHDRNEYGTTRPVEGMEYVKIYFYNTPGETVRKVRYHTPSIPHYTEEELLKINNLTRVKAYYGNREFYQPNYDKETGEGIIPDFRNTLLWEPSVITDEKGEATLSFFCSDINSDFIGRIEGVGGNGLLGTGYFKFTVRKVKFIP